MPKRLRGFFCIMASMLPLPLLLAATILSAAGSGAAPEAPRHASIQYLGHSCFVVTSAAGVRIVIDPYASGEWPGLTLPWVQADLVLVTHPSWDHDDWHAVRGRPKLLDGPGEMKKDDLGVRGLEGRHADLGGAAIGFRNTIFVVETGGLRLCHIGDNGPVTTPLREAIGQVDILMLPIDSEHRVLSDAQARDWIDALAPRLVIPMHYRLPGLSPRSVTNLGTLDEWLSGQAGVTRLPADTFTLDAASLPGPGARQILVFTLVGQTPPPDGAPSAGRLEATEAKSKAEIAAAEGDLTTALDQFSRAAEIDPGDAEVLYKIGYLHLGNKRPDRAVDVFMRAVKAAGSSGKRDASLAWLGAGMALDLLGRREEAIAAYREAVKLGVNDENQADQARRYLDTPYREE